MDDERKLLEWEVLAALASLARLTEGSAAGAADRLARVLARRSTADLEAIVASLALLVARGRRGAPAAERERE
ncbi:MAG TPA: hypothetical protein VFE37_11005 [Chloroflexota bacterium]|nr:hypothetical protein [Chloroflexota bacterium]